MSDIIMIRHGQASFGGETYDRLSDTGHRQIEAAASFFINAGYKFDSVFSGTLNRQIESADSFIDFFQRKGITIPYSPTLEGLNEHKSEEIMRGILPLVIKDEPSLSEDAAKLLKDRASFQKLYEKVILRWVAGNYNIPELQTWNEFKIGVRSALEEIMVNAGKGSRIAVFTSGGVIAASVQMALSVPDEKGISLSWNLANASITGFKFSSRGFSLSSFNCFNYLEKDGEGILTYR